MEQHYTPFTRPLILAALLGTVALFVAWTEGRVPTAHASHHTPEEIQAFRGGGLPLAGGNNTYFMGSGNCYGCHGPDLLFNYASINAQGEDVNVSDDWRSTMMANSARDPFWRAKVSHEVSVRMRGVASR